MAEDNIACVIYGKQDIRLENKPIPEPESDEIQIAVQRVGICGSDVSFYKHGRIAEFTINQPTILGHEISGIVSKTGKDVLSLEVGDRVALEPLIPCKTCHYCLVGPYNMCENVTCKGVCPDNGGFSNYMTHKAAFSFKIPDNISFEEAAFIEPLSVATSGCISANVTVGQNVLVIGAGPIGLSMLVVAKASGADKVCVTDMNQYRLDLAKKMGAHCTILVKNQEELGKNTSEQVIDALGCKPDVAIECSGTEQGAQTCIYAVCRNGAVQLVGLPAIYPTLSLPMIDISVKQIKVNGNMFTSPKCYEAAHKLITQGHVDVKPMITHVFPLSDFQKALDIFCNRQDGAVKVQIDCSKK